MNFEHVSVMLMPTVDMLDVREGGVYVDGTLGGGGHSAEILRRLNGTGHLYGIDRDNDALAAATERLGAAGNFTAVKGNFHDVKALLAERGVEKIDGMMIDLGVSSHQLDTAERGFSYHADAPLDMRMDQDQPLTAREIVAIRWHMGAYSGKQDWGTLSAVYDRYPEALCLHFADMIATHYDEVPF